MEMNWNRNIVRAFHCQETGHQAAFVEGREIPGFWVSGMPYVMDEDGQVVEIMTLGSREQRYPITVEPETVCRYIGYFGGYHMFEKDVVDFETSGGHKIGYIDWNLGELEYFVNFDEQDDDNWEFLPYCLINGKLHVLGSLFDKDDIRKFA